MATFQCRGLLADTISLKIDRVISSCVVSLGSHIPFFFVVDVEPGRSTWKKVLLDSGEGPDDRTWRRMCDPCPLDVVIPLEPPSHPGAACQDALASSIMVYLICFDVVKWQSTGVCNGTVW